MYLPQVSALQGLNRLGLGCGDACCSSCARPRLAGLGQDGAPEPGWGELFGTWAHGAVDVVTWGFFGVVALAYFLGPRVERSKEKRRRVSAARSKLREAQRTRGFF